MAALRRYRIHPLSERAHLPRVLVAALLALGAGLLTSSPSALAIDSFVEDFSTITYRHLAFTSADWNTAAGELRLPAFEVLRAGYLDTPGSARAAFVEGDRLYVPDLQSGLHVIDVTDPTLPILLSTYNTPAQALDVWVVGNLLYVADDSAGLHVIDVSDPLVPVLRGTIDLTGSSRGVCVRGDYAYLGVGSGGIRVVDVADPANPTLVANLPTPDWNARGIWAIGDRLYVADGDLQMFDISDPTAPVLIGTHVTVGDAHDVVVAGNLAYVADDAVGGLRIVDVTDPVNPVLAGSLDTPGRAFGVQIDGNHAYVADGVAGVHIIDVTDPTDPTTEFSYDTGGSSRGLFVAGEHAFIGDEGFGIYIIDVADPVPPARVGGASTANFGFDVATDGDLAVVTVSSFGVQIYNISDPAAPQLLGSVPMQLPSDPTGIALAGDHAFIATLLGGLQVVDISNPGVPALVGSYGGGGVSFDVDISGDYAYVAADGEVRVFDVSDPTAPVLLGINASPSTAFAIEVRGDIAYVGESQPSALGFSMFDISDPTTPTLMGNLPSLVSVFDIALHGDFAYLANPGGLQVIDIRDAWNPVLLTTVSAQSAQGISVVGDRAYLTGLFGIQVYDVTNPSLPVPIGMQEGDSGRKHVVSGDHLYMVTTIPTSELAALQIQQTSLDVDRDRAQSLDVNVSGDWIFKSRLQWTGQGRVDWELTADGGASWQSVVPGSQWHDLSPGTDLRWRSVLVPTSSVLDPRVSELRIEWLLESAQIESVADVGNDQGRKVRLTWTRSGYDFVGAAEQIEEYAIYRRVDPGLKRDPGSGRGVGWTDAAHKLAGWDFLMTVPATAEEEYSAVMPTLADSTDSRGIAYSTFLVRALTPTPGVFFDSPPDSGYSVDNLAPSVPASLQVDGFVLSWDDALEPDFDYYTVYGGEFEELGSATLLGHSVIPDFDAASSPHRWYLVTTTDVSGNESAPASVKRTGTAAPPIEGSQFFLKNGTPNPFRDSSSIRFGLAKPTHARIAIYDVRGRLVSVLIDRELGAGVHQRSWAGRDHEGRQVAPGIYFMRMIAGEFERSRKLLRLP